MSAGYRKRKSFLVAGANERIFRGFSYLVPGINGFLLIFALHQALGLKLALDWSRSSGLTPGGVS
jgi:hypothetical protein